MLKKKQNKTMRDMGATQKKKRQLQIDKFSKRKYKRNNEIYRNKEKIIF